MGMLDKAMADLDEISNPFFPFSPELMFQVCVAAGAHLGWTIYQSDASSRAITFHATQETLLESLTGLESLLDLGDGETQGIITIYISADEKDGKPGARLNYPIRDFESAVYLVLKKMGLLKNGQYIDPEAKPPRNAPAPTTGKNPFVETTTPAETNTLQTREIGLSQELKALAELHESGALTDEEFSAAKSKILGA